jgi:D-alanyl-D-alanine carboxypeptidase (penicillin-binding protein 5/6)
VAVVLCGWLALVAAAAPPALAAPAVEARSAILVDAGTGDVLLSRRGSRRRSIASATKLMTALLALERARPGEVFTAGSYSALPVESRIDLREGERMRVRDLLRALLLESANDAAVVIAENVSGSRPRFVALMNRRARRLGLSDTRFANPIGLDDPDNYSTAADLGRLTRVLMRRPDFRSIVDLPRVTLRSGDRRRTVDNRNRLVRQVPWVDGVKTGHTGRAGYVLVGSGSRRGARVISVVLGEPSEAARDRDTLRLLRFGLSRFSRVVAVRAGRAVERVPVEGHAGREVALEARRSLALTVPHGERPAVALDAPARLRGPLPAGARVGTVHVLRRGREAARAPLVTAGAVPEPPAGWGLLGPAAAPLTFAVSLAMVLATMLVGLRIRALRGGRRGRRRRRPVT